MPHLIRLALIGAHVDTLRVREMQCKHNIFWTVWHLVRVEVKKIPEGKKLQYRDYEL